MPPEHPPARLSTKKTMAQMVLTLIQVTTSTKEGKRTRAAAGSKTLKVSAEGPDGVAAGIFDDENGQEAKVETTEGNMATQDTGGFDKLVDLSFSGSNQTLSTIVLHPFSFSSVHLWV